MPRNRLFESTLVQNTGSPRKSGWIPFQLFDALRSLGVLGVSAVELSEDEWSIATIQVKLLAIPGDLGKDPEHLASNLGTAFIVGGRLPLGAV